MANTKNNGLNIRALLAEFFGTFALIFIGVGAIAGNYMNGGQTGLVGIALAHGLTIAVMVSATAHISGGHLNPAVTFGVWCTKKIDSLHAGAYVVSQILGAIFAAGILKLSLPANVLYAVNMGTPSLGEGITFGMGFIEEIILTAFLMFAIYGTAIDKRAPAMGGLFIGLTVVLDILMGGPISGASMNPARYLGPALMGGGFSDFWLYLLAPLVGAGGAALFYNHFLMNEKSEKKAKRSLNLNFKSELKPAFLLGGVIIITVIVVFGFLSNKNTQNSYGTLANFTSGTTITVAADGPTLNSNVAQSFDKAPYFLIINPTTLKYQAVKNPFSGVPFSNADPAKLISNRGSNTVIYGNISSVSSRVLNQNGMIGLWGYAGYDVKGVVDLYNQSSSGVR